MDRGRDFGFFKTAVVARLLHVCPRRLLISQGENVSHRAAVLLLATLSLGVAVVPVQTQGQSTEEIVRRAKSKVQPIYPDLARRMGITGTVKVEVVVSPNGTVKDARVIGGHPVLATAALDAAKKWRFEPSSTESTGIIDFKFEPR
jgi:TonB family protein